MKKKVFTLSALTLLMLQSTVYPLHVAAQTIQVREVTNQVRENIRKNGINAYVTNTVSKAITQTDLSELCLGEKVGSFLTFTVKFPTFTVLTGNGNDYIAEIPADNGFPYIPSYQELYLGKASSHSSDFSFLGDLKVTSEDASIRATSSKPTISGTTASVTVTITRMSEPTTTNIPLKFSISGFHMGATAVSSKDTSLPDYPVSGGVDIKNADSSDFSMATLILGGEKPSPTITVTAHYQTTSKEKLADDEIKTGKEGENYTFLPKDIPDYTLVKTEGKADSQFGGTDSAVTFIYDKNAGKPVTVHYQDTQGNTLADDQSLNGKIGEAFHAKQIDIKDYSFSKVSGEPDGTFSNSPQEVTFIYDKNAGKPVTVHYQDTQGNTLADDQSLNGKIGEAFHAKQIDIKDYSFSKVSGEPDGTFSNSPQEVTFIYDKNAGKPVTVHYQDTQGNTLADDQSLNGKIGEAFHAKQIDIKDYSFSKVSGEPDGTFSNSPQEVTFIYDKNAGKPVTVHYQDTQGNTLADDQFLNGKIGEAFHAKQIDIKDYSFSKVSGEPDGTFSNSPQEVTFIYDKQAQEKDTLTVSYVDETGKTLAKPTVLTLSPGQDYEVSEKKISGYQLVKVVGKLKGAFDPQNKQAKIIYQKIKASDTSTNNVLPKTGESPHHYLTIVGIILFSSLLVFKKMLPKLKKPQ
ncbi:MucBP domain-containing protein [Vagococcus entomophilus]